MIACSSPAIRARSAETAAALWSAAALGDGGLLAQRAVELGAGAHDAAEHERTADHDRRDEDDVVRAAAGSVVVMPPANRSPRATISASRRPRLAPSE